MRNPDYPPNADWDICQHEWKEKMDSMWSNENYADVKCVKCECPGEMRRSDSDVYWPAT